MMILVTICGHDDVYKAIVHQVRRTIRQMTYKTFSARIRRSTSAWAEKENDSVTQRALGRRDLGLHCRYFNCYYGPGAGHRHMPATSSVKKSTAIIVSAS
jgi:hypothetical protein